MPRTLVLPLALCIACTTKGSGEEDPAAAWRHRLADPSAYAVREGLQIHDAALKAAVLQARIEHGDRLAQRRDADLAALAEAPAPAAPAYRQVVEVRVPADAEARAAELALLLVDRNFEGTLRRTLAMHLPIAMMRDLGMTAAGVGQWLGFLSLASPTVTRCGPELVCMSYGGLDVFTFSLTREGGAAVVDTIRWHQQVPTR